VEPKDNPPDAFQRAAKATGDSGDEFSGALTFAYPGAIDQGKHLRTMLNAYAQAGGKDAVLLLLSQEAGTRIVDALGRAARSARRSSMLNGIPARVLPMAVWHTASIGIDLWLAAIAQGASQVRVLLSQEEAPRYRQALAEQMAVAQALLTGLGYPGEHLRLIEANESDDPSRLDTALRAAPALTVARIAAFAVQARLSATCWSTPTSARCA